MNNEIKLYFNYLIFLLLELNILNFLIFSKNVYNRSFAFEINIIENEIFIFNISLLLYKNINLGNHAILTNVILAEYFSIIGSQYSILLL